MTLRAIWQMFAGALRDGQTPEGDRFYNEVQKTAACIEEAKNDSVAHDRAVRAEYDRLEQVVRGLRRN